MVVDRDAILSFFFRIVPPSMKEEARLLETSVARSFGGFLRGQAILGVVYAAVAAVTSARPRPAVPRGHDRRRRRADGDPVLRPVRRLGAAGHRRDPRCARATTPCRRAILMGVGWMVVMNILQPRLMQEAVGIHPIVVLGSVLIGSKIAGVTGAIFGIPIAAVLSAFFFHFLDPDPRAVAGRGPRGATGRGARGPADPGAARAGAGDRSGRRPRVTGTPETSG